LSCSLGTLQHLLIDELVDPSIFVSKSGRARPDQHALLQAMMIRGSGSRAGTTYFVVGWRVLRPSSSSPYSNGCAGCIPGKCQEIQPPLRRSEACTRTRSETTPRLRARAIGRPDGVEPDFFTDDSARYTRCGSIIEPVLLVQPPSFGGVPHMLLVGHGHHITSTYPHVTLPRDQEKSKRCWKRLSKPAQRWNRTRKNTIRRCRPSSRA
jgi:hypothetical protein